MKKLSAQEFMDQGFLQELNRQFLHPMGLALEVIIDKDDDGNIKSVEFGDVWDERHDPEGIIFEKFDKAKAASVEQHQINTAASRMAALGYVIQTEEMS